MGGDFKLGFEFLLEDDWEGRILGLLELFTVSFKHVIKILLQNFYIPANILFIGEGEEERAR